MPWMKGPNPDSAISASATYHRTNELAIMRLWFEGKESRRALVLYLYCRARINQLIYRPSPRTLARLGWSRSAYYRNIALMKSEGLIRTDEYGNHILLPSKDFIAMGSITRKGRRIPPGYSNTIILERSCTMQQVRSAIASKLIERRWSQLTRTHSKREARNYARKRSTRLHYAESRGDGFAAMTTRQIAKHAGLSRSGAVRWKRTARDRFAFRNERKVIPMLARAKDEGFRCHYYDRQGNGVLVLPTELRPLPYLAYLPSRPAPMAAR